MELIAYIFGLLFTIFLENPARFIIGFALASLALAHRAGRHHVIMMDFNDEIARAVKKRNDRW